MTAATSRGFSTGERIVASLHCNRCELDWPVDYDNFTACPECEGRTWWMCAGAPMSAEKAISMKRHADFNRFYKARELKRFEQQAKTLKALEFEPTEAEAA